ncbi:hypothetical protein KKE06_03635 [Candidatus Micrarchaeota archaeon]|nr:hypothetical protein [Candidatus Micrarchaeota archaeon]
MTKKAIACLNRPFFAIGKKREAGKQPFSKRLTKKVPSAQFQKAGEKHFCISNVDKKNKKKKIGCT